MLLGPSGSGKSTLLRAIAGLTTIDHGRIVLHGRDVTNLGAKDREVGFVFQNYALFRHMTVADNIEFALRARRVRGAERKRRRAELLEARVARRLRRAAAERAVGRPAAARRARARARARAARAVARRAVRRARREDPRRAAPRDPRDSARRRHHDDPRDARSGRSVQHGRPDRRHGPRPASGGRRAAGALSTARHALRRDVPRRREPAARPLRVPRHPARRVVSSKWTAGRARCAAATRRPSSCGPRTSCCPSTAISSTVPVVGSGNGASSCNSSARSSGCGSRLPRRTRSRARSGPAPPTFSIEASRTARDVEIFPLEIGQTVHRRLQAHARATHADQQPAADRAARTQAASISPSRRSCASS